MQKWGAGEEGGWSLGEQGRRGQERVGSRIYKRKAKAEIEKL